MSKLERCVGCNRVKLGDQWYLEGAITAVEMTTHVDTYCPSCKKKLAAEQKNGRSSR